MNRILVAAFCVFLILAIVVGVTVSSSGFVFHHPQDPRGTRGISFVYKNDRVVAVEQSHTPIREIQTDRPKAIIEETRINFGTMNPSAAGSHSFSIRNEGDSPLVLRQGKTTCQCTMSEIAGNAIVPGGSGRIVLRWKTLDHATYFGHGATILTNDPLRPEIQLRVEGKIRVIAGVDKVNGVHMSRILPGTVAERDFILYSTTDNDMTINEWDFVSLDGFTCEFEAIKNDKTEMLSAKRAYRVLVKTPPDLPCGETHGLLRIRVKLPKRERQEQLVEVPIYARVLRRLAVYGEKIDSSGLVDLGLMSPGSGTTTVLTLKVYDVDRMLNVKNIETTPSFLLARFDAHEGASQGRGLYRLKVEIPADAPPSEYLRNNASIQLNFDHPRIHDLSLPVSFAVVGDRK